VTFHSPPFRASAVWAGVAALALGVAACGSSGRSSGTYSAGANTRGRGVNLALDGR